MSNGNLEKFGAYQKALELFDCVVDDTAQSFCFRVPLFGKEGLGEICGAWAGGS